MNPATQLMIEKLKRLAELDMTYEEAAAEAGVSYAYIARYASKFDIPFRLKPRGRPPSPPNERSAEMRERYENGETLNQIGIRFGITRERVRQIMTKHYGMRAKGGGKAEISRQKRRELNKKRDARSMKSWGCSYRAYRRILKHPDKPTYAYWAQRKNAYTRGIAWELTLFDWWKIWEQSGHWKERGRGRAYQMCRLNDAGPYSVDNVYIATGVENMQDYWANRRSAPIMETAQ